MGEEDNLVTSRKEYVTAISAGRSVILRLKKGTIEALGINPRDELEIKIRKTGRIIPARKETPFSKGRSERYKSFRIEWEAREKVRNERRDYEFQEEEEETQGAPAEEQSIEPSKEEQAEDAPLEEPPKEEEPLVKV